MSHEDLLIVAVGLFQLGFGLLLGWLRWGRECRVHRHDWVFNHFGFDQWEKCSRCGRCR